MLQNVVIAVAFLPHHGGTYLAKAYTVPPPCANQLETGGHTVRIEFKSVDHKSRTIEMGLTESAPDLKFLADGECLSRTDNL